MIDRSLWLLTLTRFRLFFREPSAVFWSFGFPIVLSIALGIAFREKPPEPASAAVEAGPGAQAIADTLASSPEVKVRVLDPGLAQAALRSGRAAVVVRPGSPVVYLFDPARPESRLARALIDGVLQRAGGRADPIATREVRVVEPGSRYIDFLIPGLVGLNLMASGMWGIAYVIVENRTQKLLRRMIATPMRRSSFLLSFILMRMVFLLVELPLLFGFGWAVFGVKIQGSLALVLLLSVLGALAFSGLGLLVASRARNTQTVGGLINLVQLPMFIASGVFFSSSNFPDLLQPAIRLLPLTALNDSLRAVVNEGAGWMAVAPQAGVLSATTVISFGLALWIFRWF